MSEPTFTCEYSPYTRRVRGVYLPVTLVVGERTAHLVIRVDCASTYCVLERPWAEYFGLTWESGDPIHIGTAVGGFQAYLHVLGLQIDRFSWETPVAIAEFESLPGAGYRRVVATGSTHYDRQLLAVPALRKDGMQISLEFTVVLVHEPPGEVRGIAAVLRDVTARWQREKAMRARLAAFESTQQA